tara:strand:+ start:42 stop:713 length:672 start_codon:yes stop_codon:yes gene_type:complete
MHQKKNKNIIFYFFLLVIVSSIHNIELNNFKFNDIQNIKVSGLSGTNNSILLKEIKNLNLGNIFFINKIQINKVIESNSLIEKYEVIKKYPDTIKILIQETNFFAKINKDGETFLIGSNRKLTMDNGQNNELPYIFGKPNLDEIFNFKTIIDKSKFSYSQIEKLYFFPSGRWDLKFKDNILIKFPENLKNETLDSIYKFLENYNLNNISIIDARINNQIILNE